MNSSSSHPGRRFMRQATLILPRTGERVKRTVTLRDPESCGLQNGDSAADEQVPLLGHRGSNQASQEGQTPEVWFRIKERTKRLYVSATSKTGQSILKCALAYLLGSLATFNPMIAGFLGQNDGKHMVATITVYFHPARSAGSMHEATLLASIAFVYATFISFTSMAVSVLFNNMGLKLVGHAIVLIVFCGGGLGFVGWLKQRLGSPLVNVACSLTSLAIITVLTKEGAVQTGTFSDDKITQVLKMVVMGIIITTAVCLILQPVSARRELRETMVSATDSLGDMLSLITRSFLTGTEEDLLQPAFLTASDRHRRVFVALFKNLTEAKWEHYVLGREHVYKNEERLAQCLERLAQNIRGLRSAAETQFHLLSQSSPAGAESAATTLHSPSVPRIASFPALVSSPTSQDYGVLAAIDEVPEESCDTKDLRQSSGDDSMNSSGFPIAHTPVDIFAKFVMHLGPSMKSLAYTLRQILDELPYGPAPEYRIAYNPNFRPSLSQAIQLYTNARKEALRLLYQGKDFNKAKPRDVEADFEEVAASCGHFSFSLQDVAEEIRVLLNILDDQKLEMEQESHSRTWKWLLFWRKYRKNHTNTSIGVSESGVSPSRISGLQSPLAERASFSEKYSPMLTYSSRLWEALRVFRRDDVKFAIKVGVGAALYALPSFIPSTQALYSHWRGEWGLLSYMLVCAMTKGDSNTTGYQRILGTCIGAIFAILAWLISQGNVYALAVLGFFVSLGCFQIIIAQGKGPMGRFIMLTYNLSALYAYSLSVKDDEDDDDEGGINPYITEIALHRVVAVISGCIWGLIITRVLWPISARRKFKNGLSLLWLQMALIWRRDPLSSLIEGESPKAYLHSGEEFALQRSVTKLDSLRKSASSEFELAGPFPESAYQRILQSTGNMLDAFHAINVVILKDINATEGEAEVLKFTATERAQLSARIGHLFQVLASSMKLEYPLNDTLPNTEHARDRLLAKIFDYRRSAFGVQETDEKDYALSYAYVLVTGQLSREILKVSKELESLFGVLREDLLKLQ
ncbi:MAG: hypothetical protein M1812_000180 [Candelaria pacifica]|nr:MAG: hypothetical protein M1812_000180 [Candelaria pacifica]